MLAAQRLRAGRFFHRRSRRLAASGLAVLVVALIATVYSEVAVNAPRDDEEIARFIVTSDGFSLVVSGAVQGAGVGGDEVPLGVSSSEGPEVPVVPIHSVQLVVDGKAMAFQTSAQTVGDMLMERGVTFGSLDRVRPASDTHLRDRLTVRVVRVSTSMLEQRVLVPPPVVHVDDPETRVGTDIVLEDGRIGTVVRRYKITYEDGEQVRRQLIFSSELVAPEERVISRGARVILAEPVPMVGFDESLIPPEGRPMEVWLTWYNEVSAGGNITFTGVPLRFGLCATDPSVIPLGTRLYVPGYGECLAADTGGAIIGAKVDLGYPGATIGHCCTGWYTIYILDEPRIGEDDPVG